MQKRKLDNPSRHKDSVLRCRYGMTLEEWNAQYERQNGRCAICGKKKEIVVDHDHRTGRSRMLLCRSCNLLIGYAQEDISILEAAIEYLNWHTDSGVVGAPKLLCRA